MTPFQICARFHQENILTKFPDYQTENMASRGTSVFSKIWPSDLVFDPTGPVFNFVPDFTNGNILISFIIIELKMWPLEHTQGFCKIWPSDLVFDPTWPTVNMVRDFIKTNNLTQFHDYQPENVASRAYTKLFFWTVQIKIWLHSSCSLIADLHGSTIFFSRL